MNNTNDTNPLAPSEEGYFTTNQIGQLNFEKACINAYLVENEATRGGMLSHFGVTREDLEARLQELVEITGSSRYSMDSNRTEAKFLGRQEDGSFFALTPAEWEVEVTIMNAMMI